ncbi:hypothetical protein SBRY_50548 [Actinacidiphila bryophytorum]|uniref:Uncharacterized protein n=1 Tax=Actinacidiphila bryophytorum TaxID=1436133 RepID=A0A9W4MJJ2_9ACTN|nr:hypothetical protein SBRY_50548 [Actinacidiphila bryophytorum]
MEGPDQQSERAGHSQAAPAIPLPRLLTHRRRIELGITA